MLPSSFAKSLLFVSVVTLIISCKKENHFSNVDATLPGSMKSSLNCKPVGLGMLVTIPNQPQQWYNLMIKWYDANGRLEHLKAEFDELYSNFPNVEFNLDYGDLSYVNDMVYLKDEFYNKTIFKVKLDAMHRPVTTWFDGLFHGTPMTDTTNIFYSLSGKIDSVTRNYKIGNLPANSSLSIVYQFEYDVYGNVTHLTDKLAGVRINFKYDYTRVNPGVIPHYVISIPLKLLEFMDLMELPHKNLLTKAVSGAYIPNQGYPDETYAVFIWNWDAPALNSTGQVYYYEDGIGYPDRGKFYSAWDCNSPNMLQSKNPTQKEFMRLVH